MITTTGMEIEFRFEPRIRRDYSPYVEQDFLIFSKRLVTYKSPNSCLILVIQNPLSEELEDIFVEFFVLVPFRFFPFVPSLMCPIIAAEISQYFVVFVISRSTVFQTFNFPLTTEIIA